MRLDATALESPGPPSSSRRDCLCQQREFATASTARPACVCHRRVRVPHLFLSCNAATSSLAHNMSRTAQPDEKPTDTRPVSEVVRAEEEDAAQDATPTAQQRRRRVETPMRPKLPPLASLALPGALPSSAPATPALSFSASSPPSSSSPEPPSRPRRRHRADGRDDDKAHVQAAIYEALRRRWSASSASELQTLADAAAEALRRKQQQQQQQQAHGVRDTAEEAAASPAWVALRAKKRKSDSLLDSDAPHLPTSSGLVIPCGEGDEEARDQVSPLPSSKRRRSSIFPPTLTFLSPCAIAAHRSAILCASRQQIRTLSLDAGVAEKAGRSSQIPSRHSAFDNLLTSLAAVKTARASLSSPFSPHLPPLRYA